jgi:hypothetical protein
MRIEDSITEEAVHDVAVLLAIAHERYAAANPTKSEITADANADPVDKSGTSSPHVQ